MLLSVRFEVKHLPVPATKMDRVAALLTFLVANEETLALKMLVGSKKQQPCVILGK